MTVILPAYNVGEYIGQCLDSVINQTYRNLEIIVVDDGSLDNTAVVVKHFMDLDNRIKYIYQDNAGSGPARNNGLRHATGTYCVFVDPDDWIEKNMIQRLLDVQKTEDFDLVCCGYTDFIYENGRELKRINRIPRSMSLNSAEQCHAFYADLLCSEVLAPPTRKLFKLNLIKEYGVLFPPYRRSQDIPFNYFYFSHISSCKVIDETLYNYRIIGQSQYVAKLKSDYYKTIIVLYRDICTLFELWNIPRDSNQQNKINEYFINLILLNIEADIYNKCSYDEIVEDREISAILNSTASQKRVNRIITWAVLHKNKSLVFLTVKARMYGRKVKRLIGK